jgi:hypothetical protein
MSLLRQYVALPYLALQRLRQAAINARRRDRTGRYLLWSALAGLTNAAMIALSFAFVSGLWMVVWWLAVLMLALLLMPLAADNLVRWVFVPAGWHRMAYVAGRYSRPGADPVA